MQIHRKLAVAAVTASMGFVPAVALANGSGHGNPNAGSSASTNAKKYGKYCTAAGETKKHVAGQKGTPFSNCVKAMAQLAKGTSTNPKSACSTETKKHVAGQKGTPYSDCVSAAAKLHKSQKSQSGSSGSDSNS
jgi:hypothetical protein